MPAIDASSVSPALRRSWLWLAFYGFALVVLGIWAIAHPFAATMATVLWLGAILAVAGIAQIMQVWSADGWRGALWHMASGAIYLLGGLLVMFRPLAGFVTLVILLAASMIGSGTVRIAGGLALRPQDGWLLLAGCGALSIAAGVVLLLLPPAESVLLPGLLVGFSLLVEGGVTITLAMAARRAGRTGGAAA